MFKNYLKIAFRNINRQKVFSFINIFGLAIGLCVFILIALFVLFELSYDKFHENFDRIYRVEQLMNHNGQIEADAGCPAPLSEALKKDYPEIKAVSRVIHEGSMILSPGDKKEITAERCFFVDNAFWEIFSFPLISGNRETALADPYTGVISEDIAHALFGGENPAGKTIRVDHEIDIKVTGVFKKLPANSHIKFDILISVSTMAAEYGKEIFERWYDNWVPLYVLLHEQHSLAEMNEKLRFALKKYQWEDSPHQLYLKPLSKIHLYSNVRHELGVNGSIKNIYIFPAVAIFVLLIACLNFVNLATARAADRAKEVGIRKVSGAHKFALVRQFLGESLLTVALSMALAIALVEFLLPEFNTIVNRNLDIRYFQNWIFSLGLVGVVIFIGILSGIYPAFFLSSFQPVQVLRSTLSSGARNITLRKSLVVLQFFISITLIIGTVIILQQVDYLLNKDPGYDSDQILTIRARSTTPEKNNLFRNEILSNPRVLNAGISDYMPHSSTNWTGISWEGAAEDEWIKINVNYIDRHLMDTYGMTIVQGRGFSREFTSDPGNVVILNETAAKKIGWNDPVGKRINYNVDYRSRTVGGATVVGIVKDYHFLSLHHTITPLMLRLYSEGMTGHHIGVKIAARQIPETISFLEEKYQQIFPEEPFNYRFLDEDFRNMYHEERKTSRVIFYLTLLAIFIACLGLFGLASFSIKQRTKEISIRKVLGASIPYIVFQLISEFLRLLILANLAAWPVAYLAMISWLQNFPYRIQIHFWVFITSGALALLIATVTVIYQAIKAAIANPVESLRYE